MRRLNYIPEYSHLTELLNLQPGRSVADVRARDDEMPQLLTSSVGPRGTVVCCAFADRPLQKLSAIKNVKAVMTHPGALPLPTHRFHAALLNNTDLMPSLTRPIEEMKRITIPAASVLVTFTEWKIELPSASTAELEMLESLNKGPAENGLSFISQVAQHRDGFKAWKFDAYLVGSNNAAERMRYAYDWRSQLRNHLKLRKHLSAPTILNLVAHIDASEDASVSISRYMALGTRSR